MASMIPISQSHPISKRSVFNQPITRPSSVACSFRYPNFNSTMVFGQNYSIGHRYFTKVPLKPVVLVAGATTAASASSEKQKKGDGGEGKAFVEEMRSVAMRLHTRDQAKEGEKPTKSPEETSPAKWEPTVDGYLRFLVDSKLVYETMESIVEKASVPYYAEFTNTGLERSESLAKDLDWFIEQGYAIPEPSTPGRTYATYLEELSEKDPQAFICHFYNVYFAHTAGGRMIGKKVAEKILNKKELEFYKWDGDLKQLLQNVRDKLNKVAESWSREEKNHCLEETEKSFKYSVD
ncbi:hypothetical protein V2J09_018719 [Rumex salicifolius]